LLQTRKSAVSAQHYTGFKCIAMAIAGCWIILTNWRCLRYGGCTDLYLPCHGVAALQVVPACPATGNLAGCQDGWCDGACAYGILPNALEKLRSQPCQQSTTTSGSPRSYSSSFTSLYSTYFYQIFPLDCKNFPPHIVRSNNMSVVGVDLGTLNTVIAVARNRGVDVVSFSSFSAFIFHAQGLD